MHLREVTVETSGYDGLGADLKAARERKGFDLAAVADELRIRHVHLQAIEEGYFDDLPGPVYAVGFVRSYAEYLGLDGEVAVEAFKQETLGLNGETKLVFPSPIPESRVPTGRLIAVSLVLASLIYAGWYYVEMNGRLATGRVPSLPERLAALAPTPSLDRPAEIGSVETQEIATERPTATNTLTGIDPATREIRLEPPQAVSGEAEPMATGEARSVDASSAGFTGASETSVVTLPAVSEELPVSVGELPPVADASVTGPAAATRQIPDAVGEAGVLPDVESTTAAFGGTESASSPPGTAEPSIDMDRSTAETQALTGEAAPPSRVPATPETTAEIPGPPPHEVSVDAVSDDPFRVDLQSLSRIAAGLVQPEGGTPPIDDSLANAGVESSELSGVAPAPLAETEVPRASEARISEIPVAAAALVQEDPAPSGTLSVTTAESAVERRDEPRVASTSLARGLDLSEHEPRVYGEGNWEARVVVKARTESWVQVMSTDDGELLLTRLLRPGDKYLVPNREDLLLMTGNAGGIEIIVDGKVVPSIGQPGTVRDNVALVPERLLAGTAVE